MEGGGGGVTDVCGGGGADKKKLGNIGPPVKSDVTTRSGDLKIGGVGTLISRLVHTYPTLCPDKVSLSQTIPNPQTAGPPKIAQLRPLGALGGDLPWPKELGFEVTHQKMGAQNTPQLAQKDLLVP